MKVWRSASIQRVNRCSDKWCLMNFLLCCIYFILIPLKLHALDHFPFKLNTKITRKTIGGGRH